MLCKIIGQILRSFPPVSAPGGIVVALCDLGPSVESHVHSLRPSLLDGFIGDSRCCRVVNDDSSRGLRVTHFSSSAARIGALHLSC